MKKALYTLTTVLLFSCGNKESVSIESIIASKNIKAIREKKATLSNEQQSIVSKIAQLNEAIEKLDPNKKTLLVTTYVPKDTLFNHYIEIQGTVATKQNLILNPEFNGILSNIYVKEGQFVNKGQLLAKIDDGGLSQQLASMEVQAELAKTTFERQERLWKQKIGSEIQYLQTKTNFEAQLKSMAQIKSTLNKTSIRAPFSGIIDDIITEKGTVVGAGQTPILRLVNLNQMYVSAEVSEQYISSIKKGTSVNVNIPVIGKKLTSKIRQAGNFINPANRTYTVEIPITNDDKSIKPNLTASLKINDYTNKKALLIPQSLISENANGNQYLYGVDKNKKNESVAKQIIITTGKSQGDLIEVLSGLKAGDELINEGARSIKNNQIIEVLK